MMILLVVTALLLLSLVLGLVLLIPRKTRKYGGYTSLGSVLGLVVIVVGVWQFRQKPLEFERPYLAAPVSANTVDLREDLDQIGFYLGAAVNDTAVLDETYRQLYNSVTPENALKIGSLMTDLDTLSYDFSEADAMVNRAQQLGLRVHGNALVFGKLSDWFRLPDLEAWLQGFPPEVRQEKLATLMDTHIRTVLNHFRGRVHSWDIINEPLMMFGDGELEKNVFYRHLGPQYIERAFQLAHEVDPDVHLILNEQLHNTTGPRAEAFVELVRSLQEKNIPLDGVGLQGHMLFYLQPPQDVADYVKRLTDMGLTVEITELEARLRLFKDHSDPYAAQGEYYREMIDALIDIPGFTGVTFWGYSDDRSWMDELAWLFPLPNEPYLLDKNRVAKPALLELDAYFDTRAANHR